MNQLTGIIIVTISTACYALLYPLLKKANQQIPPFTVMSISMFVLFALSFLASIIFEGGFNLRDQDLKESILLLILVGAINCVGFWLGIQGYKYFPLWQQTMFTLLTPVLAGIFAYFILGEKLTVNLFIGLAVMSIGLFIAVKP
ncbi:MAG TPA: DMT family transporter [Xanthomonadales bacterium]|nr:DMT family transporter [Xanthomonadales bacterium]